MARRTYHLMNSVGFDAFTFATEQAAQDFKAMKDGMSDYIIHTSIVWDSAEELMQFLIDGTVTYEEDTLKPGDTVQLQWLGETIQGWIEGPPDQLRDATPNTWVKVKTDKGPTLRQIKSLTKV